MPIYEFACPKCRVIFSFLSKRVNPGGSPVCPRCGHRKLTREMSRFAAPRGMPEPSAPPHPGGRPGEDGPDFDDPRVEGVMSELERDMEHLDENNPRHMAHLMRKMKDLMPAGSTPKELETAIKRLEAGEDPEKIEADMGDALQGFMGGPEEEDGLGGGGGGPYTRDSGLYDF